MGLFVSSSVEIGGDLEEVGPGDQRVTRVLPTDGLVDVDVPIAHRPLGAGALPAVGSYRVPSTWDMIARNVANSANLPLITVVGDDFSIGDLAWSPFSYSQIRARSLFCGAFFQYNYGADLGVAPGFLSVGFAENHLWTDNLGTRSFVRASDSGGIAEVTVCGGLIVPTLPSGANFLALGRVETAPALGSPPTNAVQIWEDAFGLHVLSESDTLTTVAS